MRIRAGYEIVHECPQPTPMTLMLSVRPERERDLLTPERLVMSPDMPVRVFRDTFGNTCHLVHAPAGTVTFSNDFVIADSGLYEEVALDAVQNAVEDLPPETLLYLLGSRYCETDRLNDLAWRLFGNGPRGWAMVQNIVDYVHERISFGYRHARATKTAWEAHEEQRGVCRDFAHLAVTLCRCMNVPARYCTGYLGDIGVPHDPAPMDFSAWFEVYLGDRWYSIDARHNTPRIGRIAMAHGRDATDVAMVTSFGACKLTGFKVVTDEFAGDDFLDVAA